MFKMCCEDIDDHAVEVYVLGQPQDDAISSHLAACPSCAERIADCRRYIQAMKKVLGTSVGKPN
jgi:hypothetical protein